MSKLLERWTRGRAGPRRGHSFSRGAAAGGRGPGGRRGGRAAGGGARAGRARGGGALAGGRAPGAAQPGGARRRRPRRRPLPPSCVPTSRRACAGSGGCAPSGLGGCLADDMGLGKTVQAIGLLVLCRRASPDGAGDGRQRCDAPGAARGQPGGGPRLAARKLEGGAGAASPPPCACSWPTPRRRPLKELEALDEDGLARVRRGRHQLRQPAAPARAGADHLGRGHRRRGPGHQERRAPSRPAPCGRCARAAGWPSPARRWRTASATCGRSSPSPTRGCSGPSGSSPPSSRAWRRARTTPTARCGRWCRPTSCAGSRARGRSSPTCPTRPR